MKLGTLRSNDATVTRTSTSHVHQTFLYVYIPFLHNCDVKLNCLISRFMENINKQRRNFISLSGLGYGRLEFNISRVRLHSTR